MDTLFSILALVGAIGAVLSGILALLDLIHRLPKWLKTGRLLALTGGVLSALLVVVILAASALGYVRLFPPTSDVAPDEQQILTLTLSPVSGTPDLSTLDPTNAYEAAGIEVIGLIFPALVTLDDSLHVEPWAAEGWDISPDSTTYTFHLRPGLHFSDGEPIDATAFAFALNRTLSPCTNSINAPYLYPLKDAVTFHSQLCDQQGHITPAPAQALPVIPSLIDRSISVPDPQTLILTTDKPSPYFLSAQTHPQSFALPQKLVDQYATSWTNHLLDNGPFGGSLFKLSKWNHEGLLVVQRNDQFWGTPSRLREIIFNILGPQDTVHDAFQSGRSDIDVPFSEQYPQIQASPGFHETLALQTDHLSLNWSLPPFDDVRMRQAFALSLNKEALVKSNDFGSTLPTNHIVPSGIPGYDPVLEGPDGTPSLQGNPARALQLAQAYAAEKCHGALNACPAVTFTISTAQIDETQQAQQMWQAALPGLSINVNVVSDTMLSTSAILRRAGRMKSGLTPTELHSLSKSTAPDRFRAHGERSAIKCR